MATSHESVGIKEIARRLGVSTGTVDRALHGRPGINALTRQRVLKMAETLGYRPNLAARFLKTQRQMVFSVNLPAEISFFFNAVREGVEQASAPFESAVRVAFRTYPRLGEGDAEAFEEALAEGANGIIIAPGHPSEIKPLIRKAAKRNIPVVCVATDAPGTERLTTVSADPYTNGAVAAELLCRFRSRPGPVAVVTGFLDTADHAEKLRGFKAVVKRLCPSTAVEVIQDREDAREGAARMMELLARHPDLTAVYASTANSLPVLRAVQDAGQMGKLTIITTDLFPELVPLIRSGSVVATMYQRPLSQGRIAFESLYRFVVEGKCPPGYQKLIPHVVMSSNLDLVLETLPMEVA
jgi:LacI family transcriptional regulator